MKEYTAQEMKANPIKGWFWERDTEEGSYYSDDPVKISRFIDGWACVYYSYDMPLEKIFDSTVFYGPIEKPEVVE